MNFLLARRAKIALLLGLVFAVAVVGFFIQSEDRELASKVLAGQELRSVAEEVKFSYPTSVRIRHGTERSSRITYYVFGAQRWGSLRVRMESSDDGLRVQSAIFDGVPLDVKEIQQRKRGGS